MCEKRAVRPESVVVGDMVLLGCTSWGILHVLRWGVQVVDGQDGVTASGRPLTATRGMQEEWQQSRRGKRGDGCPEFNSHGLRGLRGYLKPCGVLTDGGLATRAGACQHPALDSASTSVYKLGLGASAASPPKARHHHHGLLERRRPLA